MLATNMHGFQASEASLAAFAERYAIAAASVTKSGARLDLERIEAEAAGVTAPASAAAREAEEGRHSQKGGKNSSEESSEERSEESSEDGSEESSSEYDSSSSGEEESSLEEEEEEAKEKGEVHESNRPEEAEENSTSAKQTKGEVDGGKGLTTDELAVPTEDVPRSAVGAHSQDRVEEIPGSGSSASTSCGARTGSRVERSSDLLHLESRVDDRAGRAASVIAGRLSSLSLEKQPRGPLDGAAGTIGEKKADASSPSEGSGVGVGAGDGRRKNLIQEL